MREYWCESKITHLKEKRKEEVGKCWKGWENEREVRKMWMWESVKAWESMRKCKKMLSGWETQPWVFFSEPLLVFATQHRHTVSLSLSLSLSLWRLRSPNVTCLLLCQRLIKYCSKHAITGPWIAMCCSAIGF